VVQRQLLEPSASLRTAVLAIAVAVQAGSCATTEPLPPAGTAVIQIRVNNASADPAGFEVVQRAGAPMAGSVIPPTLAPKTEAEVTFYVPVASSWTIRVNGEELLDSSELGARRGVLNDIGIDIDVRGNPVWWCRPTCP
jgi:hypothetical protein